MFSWETHVWWEMMLMTRSVLYTALNECICGLKKKAGLLLMSCQGQADRFLPKFLWSEVTRCCPDIFVLLWRLHSRVCATETFLWMIIFRSLFSPSFFWDSSGDRATWPANCIWFFFPRCTDESYLAHFNSKSYLHGKLGQWPLHSNKVCLLEL